MGDSYWPGAFPLAADQYACSSSSSQLHPTVTATGGLQAPLLAKPLSTYLPKAAGPMRALAEGRHA